MAVIEINKNPSKRELKWFGLLFAAFFGVVGGIVAVKTWSLAIPSYLWMGTASVAAIYYLIPPLRRPIYLGWLYAVFPLGWAISHLVLAVTFYLVITPVGLLMRLGGRDPMNRRFDRGAASYWIERASPPDTARYFRQF